MLEQPRVAPSDEGKAINARLARRWFEEVWNERKGETVRELFHRDIEGHMEGGIVRTPEDFLTARAAILDAFPDFKVTVEAVVADAEQAVVRWSAAGTHTGGGLGIPASGRPVSFRGTTWMVFSDGRFAKAWDSWNQGSLMQQLSSP
jgi:steroid delta-isomerase-like uncharacterized protein